MDSIPALKEQGGVHSDEEFVATIQLMTTPEELLKICTETHHNGNRAVIIIGRISKWIPQIRRKC